jgi:hypothetical protein
MPGARTLGDYFSIRIWGGTAVDENVIMQARPGEKTDIFNKATIGHGAVVNKSIDVPTVSGRRLFWLGINTIGRTEVTSPSINIR